MSIQETKRLTRRTLLVTGLTGVLAPCSGLLFAGGRTDDVITDVQPYFAEVVRALAALARLGEPAALADSQRISELARLAHSDSIAQVEAILDRYTLLRLECDALGYRATAGSAQRLLVEQGWRLFLVRISNPRGRTEKIDIWNNRTAGAILGGGDSLSPGTILYDRLNNAPWIETMWSIFKLADDSPLSSLPVQYKVIEVFSRDRGRRNAIPFVRTRSGRTRLLSLDFDCLASRDVVLRVLDTNGQGCVAAVKIKDDAQRIYPPQVMRLAPDLPFQQHVYRGDGESVRLPDGHYSIEWGRGPEYIPELQSATVAADKSTLQVRLRRWIDPAAFGWYSGDTHIHAAGCSHYEIPTEGVSPETVIRHVRGEALSIGDVLTWGPGYYYQKRFFTGHSESPVAGLEHPDLQVANSATLRPVATAEDSESLIRYDLEVSGFPSSHAGHLVLLRLVTQDYPGAVNIEDWPSWNLPILKWAKAQGAVVGYAHSGPGMVVDETKLPSYDIPPFDSTGANEAIVDVTHGCLDFLSGCELHPYTELNLWYHLLNCGFRLSMVGETDFPCISDERVGMGRSYVRLDHRPVGDSGYDAWARNLQRGRLYCGDGRSHFVEFSVHGHASGAADVELAGPATLSIEATVAARLESEPSVDIQSLPPWHLERARVREGRQVPVELVVNGIAVDQVLLRADGVPQNLHFELRVQRSSWIALRILPSGHTHPVFVLVDRKPIRASRCSALWCRESIEKIWKVKSPYVRESERAAAAEAFDHARRTYDRIVDETSIA